MAAVPSPFWPAGARAAVSFSFDDARPSQLDQGLPVFAAHGLKATFYLSLGAMQARADDWRRATAAGHELGHHTATHPCSGNFAWSKPNALESYTLERFREIELVPATRAIELATGVTPRTFAYPCGQTYVGRGPGLRSYVPLIGETFLAGRLFRSEFVNDPAFCDLPNLGGVDGDGLTAEGYQAWLDRARQEGGWVVFAGHDIGAGGHQVSVAGALDAVGNWLEKNRGEVWCATVAEAAAHVRARRDAR